MKAILAACLLLASALDARAYLLGSSCLEWLADTSDYIGIYTASSVSGEIHNGLVYYSADLKLKDSLKGKPPAYANIERNQYYLADQKQIVNGDSFLVFFQSNESAGPRTAHAIDLSRPGGAKDVPMALAMNAKLEFLPDGAAILRTVRARMAAHPGTDTLSREKDWNYEFDISDMMTAAGQDVSDGYMLHAPSDLLMLLNARRELQWIISALEKYDRAKHAMPPGRDAKIVKALLDANMLYAGAVKGRLDATGNFLDPWGTPYRIDVSNPKSPRAWSCGPDKKDDAGAPGSDDIVSW